jgi:hypothetical protein
MRAVAHRFRESAQADEQWLVEQVARTFETGAMSSCALVSAQVVGSYPDSELVITLDVDGDILTYRAGIWDRLYDDFPFEGEQPQLDSALVIEDLDELLLSHRFRLR